MTIRGLRESLEQIRSYVEAGATDKALDKITATLRELDKGRLLTTTEAAELLGIRSVNTLKLLLHLEQIPTVRRGNRTMIALGELEKLQRNERVRGLRAAFARPTRRMTRPRSSAYQMASPPRNWRNWKPRAPADCRGRHDGVAPGDSRKPARCCNPASAIERGGVPVSPRALSRDPSLRSG